MKLKQIISEASIENKLANDPRMSKLINIAFRHDPTLPGPLRTKLGPNPTDKEAMEMWLRLLNNKINNGSIYGEIDQEKKYFEWLTRLYATNTASWEDISTRGAQSIMRWYMLQRRNLLKPQDRDFNKFTNFYKFEKAMSAYNEIVKQFEEEEKLKALYDQSKMVVIVDNPKYVVTIPLNFGASCKLARSIGPFANWCTGTTSSNTYFERYSQQGPLIVFMDKKNNANKYQMHPQTAQFMNTADVQINLLDFARKYPEAMEDIVDGIEEHKDELKKYWPGIDNEGNELRRVFKPAFGKKVKEGSEIKFKFTGKDGRIHICYGIVDFIDGNTCSVTFKNPDNNDQNEDDDRIEVIDIQKSDIVEVK